MTTEPTYSIYAVEKPLKEANNAVENFLFPNTRSHSYVVLANDNTQRATGELHFIARTAKQKYLEDKHAKRFYAADYVACLLGVQDVFHKAAETVGLEGYPLYMRALEKNVDRPLSDYNKQKIRSGTQHDIENLWLGCCHRALMISKRDLKYRPIGTIIPAQNCRSGTQDIVTYLERDFSSIEFSNVSVHAKVGKNDTMTRAFGDSAVPIPPQTTREEISSKLRSLLGMELG